MGRWGGAVWGGVSCVAEAARGGVGWVGDGISGVIRVRGGVGVCGGSEGCVWVRLCVGGWVVDLFHSHSPHPAKTKKTESEKSCGSVLCRVTVEELVGCSHPRIPQLLSSPLSTTHGICACAGGLELQPCSVPQYLLAFQ